MNPNRLKNTLELKIPPGVIGAFAATLMWITSSVAPSFQFVIPAKNLCVGVLVLTGVIISGLGVASFRRGNNWDTLTS